MNKNEENKVIYQTIEALKPVKCLINVAYKAIDQKDRIATDDKDLGKVFQKLAGGAGGAVVGGGIGYAALFFAGIQGFAAPGIAGGLAVLGGTMLGGLAVFAAPVVILGIGGYALMNRTDRKKLLGEKLRLRSELTILTDKIANQIKLVVGQERKSYLEKLSILLESAVIDLNQDITLEK